MGDLCGIYNGGGCDHLCINIEGSFQCACNSGYTLDHDGRTCLGKYCLVCIVTKYPNQISMNVMKTMVAVVIFALTLKEALNVLVMALSIMIFAIPIMLTSEMFIYRTN